MVKDHLYVEHLSQDLNSYELKMFRVQHDEIQLSAYLKKFAKKHEAGGDNRIYFVRSVATGQFVAWFGLKAATLPYNDKGSSFLIPAVELTHFAVDERAKLNAKESGGMRTGEFIFWNFIVPIVRRASENIACKSLFLFAIDNPKLISYYKTVLGFKEINSVDDKQFFEYAAPDYDEGCRFLYFPLA
ncbi:MAG: hypothetical protein IJ158_03145 [Treponema sp.]|nr:hypothetical protein [Treponema sp.]